MVRLLYIIALAALLSALSASACAGLPGYSTRAIQSPNGKFVLVLLAPEIGREHDPTVDGPLTEDEVFERRRVAEINAKYAQSGLYRNDGLSDLLWPIPYLTVSKDIYVCDDGIHLITAFLDWHEDSVSDRGDALTFYAHGQQLSTYREDKLLAGYFGRRLLCCYVGAEWPTCTSVALDEQAGVFVIATNWGDSFRFNIATGKLVDSRTSSSIKAVFVSLTVSVALACWWAWRLILRPRSAS